MNKYLILTLVFFFGGVGGFFVSCNTVDKNITSMKLNCDKPTIENSAFCCLQIMTGEDSNKAKAILCKPYADAHADALKEKQKQNMFTFCEGKIDYNTPENFNHTQSMKSMSRDFIGCWDKLQTK